MPRFRLQRADSPDKVIWVEDTVTVGTAASSSIRLTDDRVEQRHCDFQAVDEQLRLNIADSRIGTFVNGRRKFGRVTLRHEDEIAIGDVKFNVLEEVESDGIHVQPPSKRVPAPKPRKKKQRSAPQQKKPNRGPVRGRDQKKSQKKAAVSAPTSPPAPI